MNIKYFKWWFKYIFIGSPILFSSYWFKNTFIYKPREFVFKLIYGIPKEAYWGLSSYISEVYLKGSYHMNKHLSGYPANLSEQEKFDPDTDDSNFEKWKEILQKIRFSHFYYVFIMNESFSWMINNVEQRNFCKDWARKKYFYVAEFLTDEYWETMFTDKSLDYETTMDYNSDQVEFITINKITKEVVDISYDEQYPYNKVIKDMLPKYDEGMELFKKYYLNLWD